MSGKDVTRMRLEKYLYEANRHISHILEAREVLDLPVVHYDTLPKLEKFALNTLIFRFAKLQDLLGNKIFRTFLDYNNVILTQSGFFHVLKLLEKEQIIDIDTWSELRQLRNTIAHDYPEELAEVLEAINLYVTKSSVLITVTQKIEKIYHEIDTRRD